jgi:hypothetical protein
VSARYFTQFFNDDPMTEISEAEALAKGSYVVEEPGPPRRFRRYTRHQLDSVIYVAPIEIADAIADLKRRGEGVDAEVYGPVEHLADGRVRWRTWYVASSGEVEKILEPEFLPDGRFARERYLDGSGTWISDHVYQYNSNDELYEVTTVAPDGTVLNRHAAPL